MRNFFLFAVLFMPHGAHCFSLDYKAKISKTMNTNHCSQRQNCQKLSISQYETSPSITCSSSLNLSGGDNSAPSTEEPKAFRELVAEFVGTFIIVQLGCGTVCSAIFKSAQVGLWQIAAVWSLAVTLAISATASVSGAHLNPAITIALASSRGFSWGKVLPFIFAQVAGATAAAGVNMALFSDSIAQFETTNGIVRGTVESIQSASAFGEYWSVATAGKAFFAEAFGTAMLAFMIFALTNSKNETTAKSPHLVPPLIGGTVGALISVIAPLTQAGFNPARDFGPRIVAAMCGWGSSVAFKGWWVYVLAPIVGAVIGGKLADILLYD